MNNLGIIAKNLVVTKQGNEILRSIDFTVHPGRLTGLIGPSGAVKTTIERSIVGIQIVTSCELTVNRIPAGSPKYFLFETDNCSGKIHASSY